MKKESSFSGNNIQHSQSNKFRRAINYILKITGITYLARGLSHLFRGEPGPTSPSTRTQAILSANPQRITPAQTGKIRLQTITSETHPVAADDTPQNPMAAIKDDDELIRTLHDPDHPERMNVIKPLGVSATEAAIEALVKVLGDREVQFTDAVAETLVGVGSKAVPALVKALAEDDLQLRGNAIEVLSQISDPTSVPSLIECLSDRRKPWLSDKAICNAAAIALERIGTFEALDALRKWREAQLSESMALEERKLSEQAAQTEPTDEDETAEEEEDKKEESEEGASVEPESLRLLLELLHGDDWEGRQKAAKEMRTYAMTHAGGESRNPLIDQQLIEALHDEDWSIRWAVIEALVWMGDSSFVPLLIEQLDDSNWTIQVAAIQALIKMEDPRAIEPIRKALSDPHKSVREAAAEALGELRATTAVQELIRTTSDGEAFVRLAAVNALGKLQDAAVISALIRSLDDPDQNVRWASASSLNNITDLDDIDDVESLAKHLLDTSKPVWEEKRVCDLIADVLERIDKPEAKDALARWREEQDF